MYRLRCTFTSHYVSINSEYGIPLQQQRRNLHPTMYLLILRWKLFLMKMQKYLHPTMYLLILVIIPSSVNIIKFTSHYVSINSQSYIINRTIRINLHPTMYLLIPMGLLTLVKHINIYIPLCIY